MNKFKGKRLLELGTNISSVDIVKYAKSEGAFVLVTDYLPTEKSDAKKYADETAMISTLNIEDIVAYSKEKKIDAVLCGVNESNLVSVCKIANQLELPCYFSLDQWNKCENKKLFKELCLQHNVPVAKQFIVSKELSSEELKGIVYPVIVKPVDLCASRGIHICNNESELITAYKDAYEKSPSHNVIVEQYLVGDEISATYSFINGECRLSMLSEMYYNNEQKGMIPLPDAYIYPSKHLSRFLKCANPQIISMLKSLGLKYGSIFITGIATKDGFAFFEAGLRIAGTTPYKFVSKVNGINIMELLTEYSINGYIDDPSVIEKEDPFLKGKTCCLYSLLNSGGTIGEISGIEEARKIPGVTDVYIQRKVGDEIKRDGTLGQINVRFYIISEDISTIKSAIKQIRQIVKVTDSVGNNMLLDSKILELL